MSTPISTMKLSNDPTPVPSSQSPKPAFVSAPDATKKKIAAIEARVMTFAGQKGMNPYLFMHRHKSIFDLAIAGDKEALAALDKIDPLKVEPSV